MTLTRKAVVYLALAYIFVGLALILREPTLATFVIPLALVFFYSSLFMRNKRFDIRVRREVFPPRSFGGESIEVSVELTNASSTEISDLRGRPSTRLSDHRVGFQICDTHFATLWKDRVFLYCVCPEEGPLFPRTYEDASKRSAWFPAILGNHSRARPFDHSPEGGGLRGC